MQIGVHKGSWRVLDSEFNQTCLIIVKIERISHQLGNFCSFNMMVVPAKLENPNDISKVDHERYFIRSSEQLLIQVDFPVPKTYIVGFCFGDRKWKTQTAGK